jgi:hypothetical protein
MLGKQIQEVGGFNQVRLTKVGPVNNEVWVIKVHNLDYQGVLQILPYLMFVYNYYNYF